MSTKTLTTDNLTIEDVEDWARSAANGTETDDTLVVAVSEDDDREVLVVGLKYSCETGDLYFAYLSGVEDCSQSVRDWLESDTAEEFAASL